MIDLAKLNDYLMLFKAFTVDDAKFFFSTLTKQKSLKAGEVYIYAGDLHRKLAYIRTGLMRAYMINDNGEEVTLFFRKEDGHMASYDCVLENKPSRMFIEAFEDTQILEVDYDKLQDFMDRHPRYEKARKFFMQRLLMESFNRLESFVLLSPEERYIKFAADNKELTERVPDKYIASVLGITPESLSRIKKRIKEKQKN